MTTLVNIDKIKVLSQEKGIKLGYLAKQIGVPHTYFADIKNKNRDIPDERLSVIAEVLGTTMEYLRDQTDEKKKSPVETEGEYDEDVIEFAKSLEGLSEDEIRKVLEYVEFLKSKRNS